MKLISALLFAVAVMFTTPMAMASGKLTLQNNFFEGGKEYRPMMGLNIYEPIGDGSLAFNSWTGYGTQPFDIHPDVDWFTTKNQVDFYFQRLTVSPGIQYSFVLPWEEDRTWLYLKLDYKLW